MYLLFTGERSKHDDRQRDLAVPEVRSCRVCGSVCLLANSPTVYLHRQRHLLPAHRVPHRTHVLLLQTRLSSVCDTAKLHFVDRVDVINVCDVFTTRECGVVMRSVASVCACLTALFGFYLLTFESLDLLTSFWYAGTSSECQGEIRLRSHQIKVKAT